MLARAESARRSVLIVEDEQIVALDLQQTLRGLGYEVFAIAATADEAISRVSERRPDLVLMDIRIKGKRDGIETAEELNDRFSIPVVFLTAHADAGTIERAKLVEPWGYLVKPVKVAELHGIIELALYRHQLAARLRELQKRLEFADRLASLGTMAAGVAHEINNPLAVVMANAAFLAEDLGTLVAPLPSDSRERERIAASVADIQSAAKRIERIVSDLRAFSQPKESSEPREPTDVRRCIEWAVRATAHEYRHRAKLTTEIGALPALDADEMKLGQVLINLLLNAAHSIPPGNAARNEVNLIARTEASGRALIEVKDTGGGIPEALRERIFEPFFSTKAPGGGTGLGLSICHGIITAMGGEISVDSELGKGTAFRVFLPAATPRAPTRALPVELAAPVRGRILVIDDEEMILRMITRTLRGHEVHCTASAREALRWIDAGQEFDLILSDLMMPTMSGMELYQELVARQPELASRVIFVTGGAATQKMEAFLRSTRNHCLEKPFDRVALLNVVKEHLARFGARRGGDS
jgi:signal transduction histidine kinase